MSAVASSVAIEPFMYAGFRCSECGGAVCFSCGEGRTHLAGGEYLPVPRTWLLATCDLCDETFLSVAESVLLDAVVTGAKAHWARAFRHPGYEVSTLGAVRSERTGRHVKPAVNPGGYLRAKLSVGGRRVWAYLHTIVLESFVGPRPPGMHGAHKNGVRTDNLYTNLAWKLPAHNEADKKLHGTAPKGGARTATPKRRLRAIARWLAQGETYTAVAARFGMHRHSVSRIARGLRRQGAA